MRLMDNYYANQASSSMPHFSGYYRQRGSGFGALAAGIGRFALPIARKFILPAAKKIGRELLVQGTPELVNVVTSKKSPKQALKNTVKNTVRKQTGSGLARRRKVQKRRSNLKNQQKTRRTSNRTTSSRQRKSAISKTSRPKRSRSDFFSKILDNDR